MSYCINPKCPKPSNPLNDHHLCRSCGSQLLLQERYRVKRKLGEGSFSKIYEVEACLERPLRERGTLKVLKVLLLNDAIAVALFRTEARVLSQLDHPGIPRVHPDDYFTFFAKDRYQPLHCLVMEKVAGINLEQWQQQQNQPLSQAQALDWLRQLLETLHHIHQQLYFHRDIKPSNIMLTPSGQLVLINFGSAREVSQTSVVINSGDVIEMTSTGYTPQEQANGKAVPQSDFFALGRTFVALLTGKSPSDFLEDPRNGQLLWQHRAPQVSQAVTDLIDDLMATMPGNRPHNAQIILQRRAAIDYTLQLPLLPPHQPEFTESLVSLRLEAWIRQQRSSSPLHRVAKKFAKFKKPLLIGGILCSLGLAGTQLPQHLSSLKEPFSALFNNPWLPLKK